MFDFTLQKAQWLCDKQEELIARESALIDTLKAAGWPTGNAEALKLRMEALLVVFQNERDRLFFTTPENRSPTQPAASTPELAAIQSGQRPRVMTLTLQKAQWFCETQEKLIARESAIIDSLKAAGLPTRNAEALKLRMKALLVVYQTERDRLSFTTPENRSTMQPATSTPEQAAIQSGQLAS